MLEYFLFKGLKVFILAGLWICLAVTVIPTVSWVRPAYGAWDVMQYYGRDEALETAFPTSNEVRSEVRVLTPAQKRLIEEGLGRPLKEDAFEFWTGLTDGKADGYALILDEIGKHLPITFMVVLNPSGEVEDCLVMAFREPRGGEVKQRRFLRQFQGKKIDDPVKLRVDVQNVTGATLSCRAACFVVRKALAAYHVLYLAEDAVVSG